MNESLEKRRKDYANLGYPCYYCGCDLTKPKNSKGGVHIYKVSGLAVYVCLQCHEKEQKKIGA